MRVWMFVVLAACADPSPPPPDEPAPCDDNVVPLVTTRVDGVADTQVVPIELDGRDAWLALDTGAPLTFVFSDPAGPVFVDHAADITIGCEVRAVAGYRADAIGAEVFDGKPIVGILGLDFFAPAGEIDYPGGTLARRARVPADAAALPAAPLTVIDERALVDVVIDDVPLRLMVDTGAQSTLWLGVTGDADDEQGQIEMADGTLWDVWFGDGQLVLAGEPPRSVPVIRGLANDYIGPELEALGAQGLLGLTSIGWRRIVIDRDAGLLRLGGPRE
ncbi:MAG TPA: hypothetical protein VFQ53_13695 [Kofleriaceae bacterium]|nr:hypothetical protein [Kofleriaceae bacterium]